MSRQTVFGHDLIELIRLLPGVDTIQHGIGFIHLGIGIVHTPVFEPVLVVRAPEPVPGLPFHISLVFRTVRKAVQTFLGPDLRDIGKIGHILDDRVLHAVLIHRHGGGRQGKDDGGRDEQHPAQLAGGAAGGFGGADAQLRHGQIPDPVGIHHTGVFHLNVIIKKAVHRFRDTQLHSKHLP